MASFIYPMYNKQTENRKLLIALFSPLFRVIFKVVLRLCTQRLKKITHPRKRWKRHILFAMADLVPMAFWTTANLLEVVDGRFDESKGPWKMPSHAELLKTKSWQAFSLPWVNGRVLLKIDDLLHLPKRDIKDWKQNRSAQLVEGKQSFILLWIQGIFAPGDNGKL